MRAAADGESSCDALELAVRVLGGGPGSRFARRLTRGREITKSESAELIRLVRGNSMVNAEAKGVPGADPIELAAALDEELSMLCELGPTDVELLGAWACAR